ncbi:hypothetical protein [Gordonia araii]|uniref:hypothetical protein n=1 Tax=Gordonia araii TaxID=263909 RepID=UPI0014795A8B|nr:hypothetical protein [Gordonia araii]NNG98259.1 hypothetical protein [Gordonia araii NBRC 100433]
MTVGLRATGLGWAVWATVPRSVSSPTGLYLVMVVGPKGLLTLTAPARNVDEARRIANRTLAGIVLRP